MVFGNGSANLGRNIYTVRPDGSGLHQVTHSDPGQSNETPDWGRAPTELAGTNTTLEGPLYMAFALRVSSTN